ncbi:MAG: ribosome small subunit-dependent GTPase A [Ruminococcaceae bacterium]|nr:ribosome small subunit-dependent GTPase A [Oscillospiraceae bacterium]
METTVKGKIIKGVGGLYTVLVTDSLSELSGSTLRCRARGALRHNNLTPLAGDNVLVAFDSDKASSEDANFVIDEIVDRKSALIRPPLANLDYLFVTMAAASPAPILPTVDKLISIAEHNGIEPVIVITKRELDEKKADEIYSIYSKCGFNTFCLSAKENVGVEPIDQFIKQNLDGKIAAFAGASGIGKSTLLNRLFPELELSTSEISRKIERGRHTTREVTLFPLSSSHDCGYIADTPGFSMLDFKRFDFFELDDLFDTMREFRPYLGGCRYTKCSHTKEQDCAIIEAVKRGDIPRTRHESYVELYDILKTRKKWD